MPWYTYPAYFFAGVFLANGIPHFIHGISGKKFPTPFSRLFRMGESSAILNVAWGIANFIAGYLLIFGIGDFQFGMSYDALMVGLSLLAMATVLALYFGHRD